MKQKYSSFNWCQFLNSFLYLVEVACNEIDSRNDSCSSDDTKNKCTGSINIAVMYNMKHAIEIFTKTLIRVADNNPDEKIKTHDLDKLFCILKEKMRKGDIKRVINKINDNEDELAPFSRQEIAKFEKHAKDIQDVVSYYHKLEFLEEGSVEVIDSENTVMKYPENKGQLHVKIDYFDFAHGELDTEKLKEDIGVLRSNFNSIKIVLDSYHQNKKLNKKNNRE